MVMKKIIRLVLTAMMLISLGLVLDVLLLTILGFSLNLIASGVYIYTLVVPAPVRSKVK